MTLTIGLTGSIGTGKSMIAERFRALDIPVIDADLIAREVVEPGKAAYEKIIDTFGSSILHDDYTLNRPALGQIVFGDSDKRETLNGIIHPEIRKAMLQSRDDYVKQEVACVVMDIPLLFESKLTHMVDKILVVEAAETIQLKRILARDNCTEETAKQRIASQIPVKEKAAWADAVIDNNGSVAESYEQLANILDKWNIN